VFSVMRWIPGGGGGWSGDADSKFEVRYTGDAVEVATEIFDAIVAAEEKIRNLSGSVDAKFYFFRDRLLMPTVAKTNVGNTVTIEPVRVLPLENVEEIVTTIAATFSLGNPVVPQPVTKRENEEPPIYRHAHAKGAWAFTQEAKLWTVTKRDGMFRVMRWMPLATVFRPDPQRTIELPDSGENGDMARSILELLTREYRKAATEPDPPVLAAHKLVEKKYRDKLIEPSS
jgi:hypothetical protein